MMTFQHQYPWKHEAMVKLVRLFCERGPTACCAQVWLNTNGNLFIFSEGVANIPQFKSYSLIQWLAYSIANCVGTFLALVFLLKYFENQSFSFFRRKKVNSSLRTSLISYWLTLGLFTGETVFLYCVTFRASNLLPRMTQGRPAFVWGTSEGT